VEEVNDVKKAKANLPIRKLTSEEPLICPNINI
jgi:hypothetical protein